MLDPALIDDIKRHADIVKIISCYDSVIKKGKEYLAICPFHSDTNPSLHISPEKQIFKCFVCGTGGDVFRFVQKRENISAIEAIRKVAELSGYHDPRLEEKVYKKPVDEKREPLIKCLKDLTTYYQYTLSTDEGKLGLDYFKSRQINDEMISKYKLGYAQTDGKSTIQFLQSKGHSLQTIEACGIATVIAGQYADKNIGRVVFPICDVEGNVIAYSARTLKPKDEAKYINTQETYLFHKSNVLYNYHIAKDKSHLTGYVYLCEGFMDVFALSRIGIDSAVALMGTAITNEHIKLLRSLNVQIRICLDGDLPGQTAAMKAAKVLDAAGLEVMIVDNQNTTYDPDEIYIQQGPEALESYLNKLISRIDFALNYFMNSNPLQTQNERKKLIKEFIPILKNLKSSLEYSTYVRKLSTITGFDFESINQVVKESKNDPEESTERIISKFDPNKKLLRKLELAEREILYQMTNNKDAIKFYEEKVTGFYDDIYRKIANYIIEYASTHDDIDVSGVINMLESDDSIENEQLINELTTICFEKNHIEVCTEDLLCGLLESINEEKNKIYEQDILNESLLGKSPQEQARILTEYNRRKLNKLK